MYTRTCLELVRGVPVFLLLASELNTCPIHETLTSSLHFFYTCLYNQWNVMSLSPTVRFIHYVTDGNRW